MFDRHATLNDTQIINYKVSSSEKWMVLIGIKSEPGTNRIIGAMQLYSKEKNVSQPIEGHAAAFADLTVEGGSTPSTLFTFAAKTSAGAKLHVIEVAPGTKAEGTPPFGKKNTDIFFPPEAAQDFPVAMQISQKYSVVYMVTKARAAASPPLRRDPFINLPKPSPASRPSRHPSSATCTSTTSSPRR